MRTFLYTSLTDHLKKLTDLEGEQLIKHIDLWNEQVEFIEQETPFATPAIFIELSDTLMPFHQHSSIDCLLVLRQCHLYSHYSFSKFEHLVHTHIYA